MQLAAVPYGTAASFVLRQFHDLIWQAFVMVYSQITFANRIFSGVRLCNNNLLTHFCNDLLQPRM